MLKRFAIMKAMVLSSFKLGESLVMREFPDPIPSATQVRVSVRAIGVNPVDWKMRTYGPLRLAAQLLRWVGISKGPLIIGVDFSGVVDAVGHEVSEFKIGDRVVGGCDFSNGLPGSYADTVIVNAKQITHLPAHIPFDIGGALPVVGVTAWLSVVEMGQISAGKRLLLLGAAGGVGQFCIQVAKNIHNAFVVAVCSTKNLERVRHLGADVAIDYTQGDALLQARQYGPFDCIIDAVGDYSGSACRSMLVPGGKHIIVSSNKIPSMLQIFIPPFSSRIVLAKPTGKRLKPVLEAVSSAQVHVEIAERMPLKDAEQAHELSKTHRVAGKIVLQCDPIIPQNQEL